MNSQNQRTDTPIAFSAVYRVHPDARNELPDFVTEYVETVRASGPGTLSLSAGVSDDGTRLAITALHADTDAMEEHLVTVAPFIERSFQLATVESITVVGTPGPRLSTALEANGSAGASVTVVECAKGFVEAGAGPR
ncbi:antibiotic biosynthesis monooxygenase [Agromyces sp. SYSU K20354]|uniref:putative quinol monooxygenase n=1 Tax=Agromyces cavernae TaxID=2898659 RepID=UPI001E369CF9|nr:antibiotic biosynthesis monooxygenase [Agromyces cavernae]MCD2442853.1 antibiotic biosynthesis monooxygenase [Agromyces cavernae]